MLREEFTVLRDFVADVCGVAAEELTPDVVTQAQGLVAARASMSNDELDARLRGAVDRLDYASVVLWALALLKK